MSLATASTSLQQRLDELRAAARRPGRLARPSSATARSARPRRGVLNLDTGVEATTESLFQIGSITKVWTTTRRHAARRRGARRARRAASAATCPEFRVADESVSEAVTIRHLLTHSSGIDGDNFADTGRGDDALEKYVASCAALRQVHPLGATMSYCNTGFSLLGRVIEVVTGEVWDAAIRARLVRADGADPHGDASRGRPPLPRRDRPHRAARARAADRAAWGLPRTAGPAGGICSTRVRGRAVRAAAPRPAGRAGRRAGRLRGVRAGDAGRRRSRSRAGATGSRRATGASAGRSSTGTAAPCSATTAARSGRRRSCASSRTRASPIALLTNGGNPIALFRELFGELLPELAGVELPAAGRAARAAAPRRPVGVRRRLRARGRVDPRRGARTAGLVAVQTVDGLGSEMTPEPFELPLHLAGRGRRPVRDAASRSRRACGFRSASSRSPTAAACSTPAGARRRGRGTRRLRGRAGRCGQPSTSVKSASCCSSRGRGRVGPE